MGERLTWQEIKEKYPNQNVGLIECYPNKYKIESAIVKYSDENSSYDEMLILAYKGEITMRFTSLDKCVVLKQ